MNPISARRRLAHRTAGLSAVLISCLLLAGCSVGSSSGGDSAVDGGGIPEPGVQAPDGGGEDGDEGGEERQVVSTASISLSSPDPIALADKAVGLVLDVDGHVDRRTDSPIENAGQGSAQLVLRVPSESLDETLTDLKALGELIRFSLQETDVTTQAADIDARIAALQTGVDRLLSLMAQATTTADLIDLESALSQRQTELDGLKAQRDSLRDSVDYAAVEMFITTPGEVAGAAPGDFWGGVVVGFQSMVAFFGGLLVVLGVLLPWLLPLAILALLLVWLLRRRRRVPPATGVHPQQPAPPRPPLPTEPHPTPEPAPVRD